MHQSRAGVNRAPPNTTATAGLQGLEKQVRSDPYGS
jgi:hypothetical protein